MILSKLGLRTFVAICVLSSVAQATPSAAFRWLDVILEAGARDVVAHGARPTILSRSMAIPATAMYDAWAAYDSKAIGTRLGATLRRPESERTVANKEIAIAFAVYRTLLDLYPNESAWLRSEMKERGLNPDDASTDPGHPQGVGNAAAAAIISFRHADGANQLGDEAGSSGEAYSDYTFYRPVNSVDKMRDPDRWQPIPFDDGKGGKVVPGFLTPHWYRVKPFALERADQFRPAAPPKVGSPQLRAEVAEVMKYNSSLTLKQKALVEFMRDGPRSTGQSGHWLHFAENVSARDHFDLDRDVKLFFAVANTAFDAFIASWDAKRYYDSARPWSLVRYYHSGKKIAGWAGPGKGISRMPASEWHPYSPFTFVTPPFPGYTSGHSTVSGACGKMLELFTGSDRFGHSEKWTPGSITESSTPSNEVTLEFPTFSDAAEQAGISRIMGGYHIQADNVAGLKLGRDVASYLWPKIEGYFNGETTVR